MRRAGRAIAMGETSGLIKVMVDADTEELLGMHLPAHLGAGLLPQGVLSLHTPDRGIGPLEDAVYPPPTLSEAVKAAVANLRPVDGG